MQPVTYIFFKNQCRAAMTHYGDVFGTEPQIMSYSDLPEEARGEMSDVPTDAVMHAALPVGDGWLYGSDDPSGETPAMAGCNINLSFPDEAETRRVYEALSEGGDIRQRLEPAFFAPLFSAFTDRFGTRWMVMTDSPQQA